MTRMMNDILEQPLEFKLHIILFTLLVINYIREDILGTIFVGVVYLMFLLFVIIDNQTSILGNQEKLFKEIKKLKKGGKV